MTFSYLAGIEEVTFGKLVGLVLCFVGAVFVALQDTDGSGNGTTSGDVVALLAAAGYGLYTTIIRVKVRIVCHAIV